MKLICVGCGLNVEAAKAKTLDGRLIMNKGDLVAPTVSSELAPLWLKVAKSRPGVDAVCEACSGEIFMGIGTIKVKGGGTLGGVSGFAPIVAFPIPKMERAAQSEPTKGFTSAVEVANAIKRGLRISYVKWDGGPTRCIVSLNAPDACDRWEDWHTMRTLQPPNAPRVSFAFCDECREIVEKDLGVEFGVTLFEAVTGDKPRAPKPVEAAKDNIIQFPTEPTAEVVSIGVARERRPAMTPPARRFTSARPVRNSASTKAVCNVASQVTGYPFERIDEIPIFDRTKLDTSAACFDVLGETNGRYTDLIVMHGDRGMRRESEEWRLAKDAAKACDLHGPETKRLGQYRFAVIQLLQERWPEEWRQRNHAEHVGKYSCRNCGLRVNLLFDPATHSPVPVKEGEPVSGVCGACNKRVSRDEKRAVREQAQVKRRAQDATARLASRGKSGAVDNRKSNGKGRKK